MGGLLFGNQFHQGIGESKLGIGVFAFLVHTWCADQRIVGAENQGKGIEQEDFFIHAPKVAKREEGLKKQNPGPVNRAGCR